MQGVEPRFPVCSGPRGGGGWGATARPQPEPEPCTWSAPENDSQLCVCVGGSAQELGVAQAVPLAAGNKAGTLRRVQGGSQGGGSPFQKEGWGAQESGAP